MSLCKFIYKNKIFYFNPSKVNYITTSIMAGYSSANIAETSYGSFYFYLDDQKVINIDFNTRDQGIAWVDQHLHTFLCKYTYENQIFYLNPNKINEINSIIRAGSTTANIAEISYGNFLFYFDNKKAINIDFDTRDQGMAWVEKNLMLGECPTDSEGL